MQPLLMPQTLLWFPYRLYMLIRTGWIQQWVQSKSTEKVQSRFNQFASHHAVNLHSHKYLTIRNAIVINASNQFLNSISM